MFFVIICLIFPKSMKLSSKYFWYITLITFLSFSLRFEGLWTLDGPIFDEIFYPQYGLNYLQNVEFFYPHPPLANYLYSFSIWAYITVSSLFGLGGALVDFESLNPMMVKCIGRVSIICFNLPNCDYNT